MESVIKENAKLRKEHSSVLKHKVAVLEEKMSWIEIKFQHNNYTKKIVS